MLRLIRHVEHATFQENLCFVRPNDSFCVSWTMIRNRMCLCHHFCHPKLKFWRPPNHLDVTWPWSLEYLDFQNFQKRTKICTSECILDVGEVTSREKLHSYLLRVHLKSKRRHFSETETVLTYGALLPTLDTCQNGHDLLQIMVKYDWLKVCSYSWKYLSHLSISPDKMTYKWHNLNNVNTKC